MGSEDGERSATGLLDVHGPMVGGPSRFHSPAPNGGIQEVMTTTEEDTAVSILCAVHLFFFFHAGQIPIVITKDL